MQIHSHALGSPLKSSLCILLPIYSSTATITTQITVLALVVPIVWEQLRLLMTSMLLKQVSTLITMPLTSVVEPARPHRRRHHRRHQWCHHRHRQHRQLLFARQAAETL